MIGDIRNGSLLESLFDRGCVRNREPQKDRAEEFEAKRILRREQCPRGQDQRRGHGNPFAFFGAQGDDHQSKREPEGGEEQGVMSVRDGDGMLTEAGIDEGEEGDPEDTLFCLCEMVLFRRSNLLVAGGLLRP